MRERHVAGKVVSTVFNNVRTDYPNIHHQYTMWTNHSYVKYGGYALFVCTVIVWSPSYLAPSVGTKFPVVVIRNCTESIENESPRMNYRLIFAPISLVSNLTQLFFSWNFCQAPGKRVVSSAATALNVLIRGSNSSQWFTQVEQRCATQGWYPDGWPFGQ